MSGGSKVIATHTQKKGQRRICLVPRHEGVSCSFLPKFDGKLRNTVTCEVSPVYTERSEKSMATRDSDPSGIRIWVMTPDEPQKPA